MSSSYSAGKDLIQNHVRENYDCKDTVILDVGPGCGTYKKLLPEYSFIGLEVFAAYVTRFKLDDLYERIIVGDVRDIEVVDDAISIDGKLLKPDLCILGDVLEHLNFKDARSVLDKLQLVVSALVISVPWQYKQGIFEGNVHEIHLQDDLTPGIMAERYPELRLAKQYKDIGIYFWSK